MIDEFEAYHGSDYDFNKFDASYIKESLYGWGSYFTTDIELAKEYGKKLYTVQLPDDGELLDLDSTDKETKLLFFQLVKDDVMEKRKLSKIQQTDEDWIGILKRFENKANLDNKLYMYLWEGESLFYMCFDDAKKAKIEMSEIIKSQGYIGCKHDTIISIFDTDNITITKKEDNDFYTESVFSFQNIITEALSQRVYHFTNLDRFYRMVDHDKINFSVVERGNRPDIMGNGHKYYLSTTRVKDSRFGYSQGFNVRIELNADAFNSNFKAKPVAFFKGGNPKQSTKDYYSNPKKYDVGQLPYYIQTQSRTENEDRIFSDKPFLKNIDRYITRVDVFLNLDKERIRIMKINDDKVYNQLRDLYNSPIGLKLFVYNDKKEFDRQGKNITTELLEMI